MLKWNTVIHNFNICATKAHTFSLNYLRAIYEFVERRQGRYDAHRPTRSIKMKTRNRIQPRTNSFRHFIPFLVRKTFLFFLRRFNKQVEKWNKKRMNDKRRKRNSILRLEMALLDQWRKNIQFRFLILPRLYFLFCFTRVFFLLFFLYRTSVYLIFFPKMVVVRRIYVPFRWELKIF